MTQNPPNVRIEVDTRVYPLRVIYQVCYLFTGEHFLWILPQGENAIRVEVTPKSPDADIHRIKGEFGNALIDFALRDQIHQETRTIREVLVSSALAEALPPGGTHGLGGGKP